MVVPSHTSYADDIMLSTKGNRSSLDANANLFQQYADFSGQVCNTSKSILYAGSRSVARHGMLANRISSTMGQIPFIYLGVPIFKGRPKKAYLQPIADIIKGKLTAWKASLLSIAGRIQLVRSVIQGR
ncbi:unnamed protein product [Vicia faba]|uniref:Reverse transcriptase domain-containing protein n=1 Tax=Vicia faba TaxID=3906 RepID=A0AAV0ZVM3_VICFA|nr:unnamed protein product [Vicia faba]